MTKHIGCDGGGYYVEWYSDDDGGSGYGEEAKVARWYGATRGACERRADMPPPRRNRAWWPLSTSSGAPPHDAATATGMYDRDF